jgi:hypothetical protein
MTGSANGCPIALAINLSTLVYLIAARARVEKSPTWGR